MPRLIDDIRAGELVAPFFVGSSGIKNWRRVVAQLRPMLGNAELPVIPIDDVISFYYEGNDQETWNIDRDFPNLKPPHTQYWAEGRMPKRIISRQRGDSDVGALVPEGRMGFLVPALAPKNVVGRDIPANTSSILWMELFIDYGHGRIEGPHGSVFYPLNATGELTENPVMQSYVEPGHTEEMHSYMAWFYPVLLAISSRWPAAMRAV